MSLIFALIGDVFILGVMWKSRVWIFGRHEGMFETKSDAQMRRVGGVIVWIICIIGIIVNHLFIG